MSYYVEKDCEMAVSEDGRTCVFTKIYKGRRFTGVAHCHEDDIPFLSEHTGLTIAEARATIKYLKFKKSCEVGPVLKAIAHMINTLPKHKSYECTALKKEYLRLVKLYDELNADIKDETQYLKEYIEKKDALHERLAKRQ